MTIYGNPHMKDIAPPKQDLFLFFGVTHPDETSKKNQHLLRWKLWAKCAIQNKPGMHQLQSINMGYSWEMFHGIFHGTFHQIMGFHFHQISARQNTNGAGILVEMQLEMASSACHSAIRFLLSAWSHWPAEGLSRCVWKYPSIPMDCLNCKLNRIYI